MKTKGSESFPPVENFRQYVAFRDNDALERHLSELKKVEVVKTGESRAGQSLFGMRFGRGPVSVSVIAGSHADEPAGPMTAQALPLLVADYFPALLDSHTFHVVPQMNPDGADRNRAWFRERIDLSDYLEHVVRELPGDDIEFGFGEGEGVRSECVSAMGFLRTHAPYAAHYSLHGMGFAEGAWCLLSPEWRDRSGGFQESFRQFCTESGVPLHDAERKGEKGFHWIAPGFCTTPNSNAMKDFFLAKDDGATADKFHPSSMEWIRSLGGDPLCIVSEMPLFQIGKRTRDLDRPVGQELRDALATCRNGERASTFQTIRDFQLAPLPFEEQIRAQFAMIVLSLLFLIERSR